MEDVIAVLNRLSGFDLVQEYYRYWSMRASTNIYIRGVVHRNDLQEQKGRQSEKGTGILSMISSSLEGVLCLSECEKDKWTG